MFVNSIHPYEDKAMYTQHTMRHVLLAMTLAFVAVLSMGCQPNFVIRHRSFRTTQSIRVYGDQKLFCVVRPQSECKKTLKPGIHTFYAVVKGSKTARWASKTKPSVFIIDKETRIDLHDPRGLPVALAKLHRDVTQKTHRR